MAKKYINWKTKGMNRDMSVSAFNPEFAYENVNLRLATNEGNTTMSWVNERGPSIITIEKIVKAWDNTTVKQQKINGTPIGTAVLNHQLVIFTTTAGTKVSDNTPDRIYVFKFSDNQKTTMTARLLFEGNLNFHVQYPLETMVAYEAAYIQKVYWTDNKNQPRMINIAATDSKIKKWNTEPTVLGTFFDFVPSFKMKDSDVNITMNTSAGGLFAPGVIQYAFTYINKYGQESNIAYLSTLYYLSHSDRGASPEDKVTSSFNIKINNPDYNFDYIRLYSIQRTSLNAEPFVKKIEDIPITKAKRKENSFVNARSTSSDTVTKNYVYTEEDYPFLPKEISNGKLGRKIKGMTLSKGSYTVNVTPFEEIPSKSFTPQDQFTLNGYDESTKQEGGIFCDLQQIIDMMEDPENDYQEYEFKDYYVRFRLSQDWDEACSGITAAVEYDSWALCMNHDFIPASVIRSNNLELIYDFGSQLWYLTNKNVTVDTGTETPDIPTVPDTPSSPDHEDEELVDIIYVDNGTAGSTIDPTELLYIGGKDITALTMTSKDNTLFLGNITQKNSLVTSIQDYYDKLRSEGTSIGITFENDGNKKSFTLDHTTGIYSHTNMLTHNLREISTFKGGETYRFGFQLQKKTGEWSEPIFMDDVTNSLYPATKVTSDVISLIYAKADIAIATLAENYNAGKNESEEDFYSVYQSVRPVIVYPSIGDRNVLCQGVLNPTVFNAKDRIDSSPYAQASWFFRPYTLSDSGTSAPVLSYDDLKINISSKIIDSNSNADEEVSQSINSYFKDNKLLQSVYVIVADVDNLYVGENLSRGELRYSYIETERFKPDYVGDDRTLTNIQEVYPLPFIAAVNLGTLSGLDKVRYAFISDRLVEEGDEDYETDTTTGHRSTHYIDGLNTVRTEKVAFSFYKGMKKTGNNLCYYMKPTDDGASNPYIFKFYAGGILYTLEFTSLADDSSYIVDDSEASGNALKFTHYDSLYTTNDFVTSAYNSTEPSNPSDAKQLEIEGAVKSYSSPFNTYDQSNGKSNTQFFIDQSIVTLNSPDIEFDTEVQSYGVEGLELRIVGAIPVTAYASAHSIKISSNMLETYHNINTVTSHNFGIGEKSNNVIHNNISSSGGNRLVSEYLWNDVTVKNDVNQTDGITTGSRYNFLVYPWQRAGSMNNDTREKESTSDKGTFYASSYLQTKKESHILFSINSAYMESHNLKNLDFENISTQFHLTENDEVRNIRLPKQAKGTAEINYYPNIDKVLTNEIGYKVLMDHDGNTYLTKDWSKITKPISMKYKSTSHAVIALDAPDKTTESSVLPILPYATYGDSSFGKYVYTEGFGTSTFWGDTITNFTQASYDVSTLFSQKLDFLWLAELYKDVDDSSRFGGKGKSAVMANKWLVCGEAVPFDSSVNSVTLYWTEGDTFYQRYDCLKTYPFTNDDVNQNTEILSFMCETHVNIDGRYDKNRGQIKNYTMRPENFNKLNPVYSQQNNFFTSRKLDTKDISELSYPNHIYYSKTKESGADIDLWTNVTLASTLELDGDKGQINSLNRLNDQIIAFQDSGISQILYNENVQIASSTGVPIEIANSGKVQGKRYLSDTIGCPNKWSIAQTPTGIYFMDNNDKSIYLFNGQLTNISTDLGFNSWAKQNIPSSNSLHKWNPQDYNNFRAVYDKLNQDVLFINNETSLAYSEKLKCFTSFYDYEGSPFLENFDDVGIWIRDNKLWKHQAGQACNFFGENKSYSMTLIGNQDPQLDKIFTNLEFRANVKEEGTYNVSNGKFTPYLPFDSLEVWNEYQHGILNLSNRNRGDRFTHGKDNSILARKFRMWRCDIPRDNAEVNSDTEAPMGIKRFKARPLDRIRNPWAYIKLTKNSASKSLAQINTEIHDIMATYFS